MQTFRKSLNKRLLIRFLMKLAISRKSPENTSKLERQTCYASLIFWRAYKVRAFAGVEVEL
jgi:hypothetical protein